MSEVENFEGTNIMYLYFSIEKHGRIEAICEDGVQASGNIDLTLRKEGISYDKKININQVTGQVTMENSNHE